MKKKYKTCLIIIIILFLIVICIGLSKIFFDKRNRKETIKTSTNIISNINDFGYTLDDRDTKYMKETFKELVNVLNEKEINEESYASLLAKLFIIDFYTLNNKINKYDVGSLEYVLSSKVDSFKNKAMDTVYKEIVDNTYKDRIQDLPEITDVEVLNIKLTSYTLNDEEYPAYKVSLNFSYKKDLGYDKEGVVYLIKIDNKLEVVNFIPELEE